MLHMLTERPPIITFYKTIANTKSDKQSDENKSESSKSSRYTKTIKASSITRLRNSQIKTKKAFIALNTRIEEMENE